MATVQTNTNNTYYAVMTVTEAKQSISENYTDLDYSVTLYNGIQNFSGYTIGYDVYINGTQVAYHTNSGNQTSMGKNSSKLVVSGTTRVYHNPDGSKSVNLSVRIFTNNASYLPVELNGSGVMELTKIPRYATCNQSFNSKTSSSIKVNWSSDSTIDYVWYSIGNGWVGVGSVDSSSGSYTITGLSPNTAYSIVTKVRRKDSQLETQSSSLRVTTFAKTTPSIWLSSKTINSITVASSCNVTTSSVKYRIYSSENGWGSYQSSATFTGLQPNTSYTIEVYAIGRDSGEAGYAYVDITTYDYAKLTSYSNFNHGDNETIQYRNDSGNSSVLQACITDTQGGFGYANYRNISSTSEKYVFEFTDTELDNFYKAFKNSNTLKVRIYIRTYCNEVYYYDYKEVTVTLTGNQKTVKIEVDGQIKRAKVFVCVNGQIKRAVAFVGVNGVTRRCL